MGWFRRNSLITDLARMGSGKFRSNGYNSPNIAGTPAGGFDLVPDLQKVSVLGKNATFIF